MSSSRSSMLDWSSCFSLFRSSTTPVMVCLFFSAFSSSFSRSPISDSRSGMSASASSMASRFSRCSFERRRASSMRRSCSRWRSFFSDLASSRSARFDSSSFLTSSNSSPTSSMCCWTSSSSASFSCISALTLDFSTLRSRMSLSRSSIVSLLAIDLDECLATGVLGVPRLFLGGLDLVLEPGDVAPDLLYLPLDGELFVLALAFDLLVQRFEFVFEADDGPLALVEFLLEFGEFVFGARRSPLRSLPVPRACLRVRPPCGSPRTPSFSSRRLWYASAVSRSSSSWSSRVCFSSMRSSASSMRSWTTSEFLEGRLLLLVELGDARDLVDYLPASAGVMLIISVTSPCITTLYPSGVTPACESRSWMSERLTERPLM